MAYAIVMDNGRTAEKDILGVVLKKFSKKTPALASFKRSLEMWAELPRLAKKEPTAKDEELRARQEAARKTAETLVEKDLPRVYLAHGPRHAFREEETVAKADCWDWVDKKGKEYKGDLPR